MNEDLFMIPLLKAAFVQQSAFFSPKAAMFEKRALLEKTWKLS